MLRGMDFKSPSVRNCREVGSLMERMLNINNLEIGKEPLVAYLINDH